MVLSTYAPKIDQKAKRPTAKVRTGQKQTLGQMLTAGGSRQPAALASLGKTAKSGGACEVRSRGNGVATGGLAKNADAVDGLRAAVAREVNPELVIDRPKGFKKIFHTKNGPKELAYPLDYGYFKGVINPEDNEDADVFTGSGGVHHGQFMKGKPGIAGTMVPDERKWYSGLTDAEFKTLHDWWHNEHDAELTWDWRKHPHREAVLASMGWAPNSKTAATAAMVASAIEPDWRSVPGLVRERLKLAASMQSMVKRVLRGLSCMPGYGDVWWNGETKTLWGVLGDSDDSSVHNKWHNTLQRIPGVRNVKTEAESNPPDRENWIRIKKGTNWANLPYEFAGHLTGGPSPLSNAIVNTLVGGGLGYAGGALIDNVLPDQYFEKNHWRNMLAGLGAGVGVAKPMLDAYQNHQTSAMAGQPLGMSALITPHTAVPYDENSLADMKNLGMGINPGRRDKTNAAIDLLGATVDRALIPAFFKQAADDWGSGFAAGLKPLPVDAFGASVWGDVHNTGRAADNPYGTRGVFSDGDTPMHTPPAVAAATMGLVTGLSSMYGGANLLSPQHIIRGLAAAGVDAATARVAGATLGVLGGMRPEAQRKLQDLGIWSGMLRGVTGSVLGLY